LRLEISLKLTETRLALEYRRGFASLLKEAIHRASPACFARYYSRLHTLKPFTFSIFFPGLTGREGNHFEVGSKAILNFSTSCPELCASVYNGLLQLRSFLIFENKVELERLFLKPKISITQDAAVFKTMAPVLVNTKGKPDWYLLPGDKGFEEGLAFSVREIGRAFLGMPEASVEFRQIAVRRKVVRHYNMDMQGFVGTFELRGSPTVLNLIYDIGLGVRRSQGFGMLELVRQGGEGSISPSREEKIDE
jgi:CRISPR-associated endoribonuclease Cas6